MNFQFSILFFILLLALALPSSILVQSETILPPETLLAETPSHLALRTDLPHSTEEAKEMGEKGLEVTKEKMPGILERIWKEEALPFWQKMWTWTKSYWKDTLWPKIRGFWERRIKPPVEEEVEKRKEIVEESIEKEKEELQETFVPESAKSLWEKLKELIK